MLCSTVWCGTVQCCALQSFAVQCGAVHWRCTGLQYTGLQYTVLQLPPTWSVTLSCSEAAVVLTVRREETVGEEEETVQ